MRLFIGVLGGLANAFVLIVLLSSKKSLASTVNVFVINQSFLDMVACFLVSAASAIALSGVSKFSLLTCILIGGGVTTTLAINASVMSMVVITLERYVKIVHPIVHRNHFRRWMTYVGVVFCWVNGLSTCVMADLVVGNNCLSIPLEVGKVNMLDENKLLKDVIRCFYARIVGYVF